MWWAFLKCVSVIAVGIWLLNVQVSAWSLTSPPNFQTSNARVFNQRPCSETFKTIVVSGEGAISACVMGSSLRVAAYISAQGVAYAISFPFESTFYRLDVCGGIWGCVYAEPNDTFMGMSNGYTHFATHLVKTVQNGVTHYGPNEQATSFSFHQFGSLTLSVQSVALSQNGEWATFEAKEYGLFRLNISTLEVRRFTAPGYSYGYGYDPRVEMAISNDGSAVGVMGLNLGLSLVNIDETCGDRPNEFMQPHYIGAITACRYVPTPTEQYIPNFTYAANPRFNDNGSIFSFTIFSNATAPRHVSLFSAPNRQSIERYVALGDSFTGGEGEVDDQFYEGGATNPCHVSTRSYPFLLAQSWDIAPNSVACSGATIDAARGKAEAAPRPTQLSELESSTATIATVGIGGNDAGLMGKLKTCLGLDTCEWAETPESRQATAREIQQLYPRLRDFYKDVKARTSGAVIVVGYPRIITSEGECASAIGLLLNSVERVFMNETLHYLNQVIQAAASAAEVEFVDTEEAFAGGELCTSNNPPFMNGIRLGDDIAPIGALPSIKIIGAESFHPTPEGHGKVAQRVLQMFPNPRSLDLCETCLSTAAIPDPSAYWNSNAPPKNQKAISFLKNTALKKGDPFEISFPALSFAPFSQVTFELHSEVQKLGSVRAAEDGSVSMNIGGVEADTGYHSIHALGESFTGEGIDAYDFVSIDDNGKPEIQGTITSIPAAGLPPPSVHASPQPFTQNSAAVLGATTEVPAMHPALPSSVAHKLVAPQAPLNIWPFLLFSLVILEVIGLGVYLLYRQKQSRYEGG